MSYFKPWMQEHREIYSLIQDEASVHLPPAEEVEEDWSDLRWGLSHLPASVERDQILQALIVAENAASEYLDEHEPPTRPVPDWMEDDSDEEDE